MSRHRKQKGAVSVFLVIILVPCLLFSSMFVDIGRLYLSKGMAQSSAELALNTLMTNYDYDLNDFYGMIASCQTIDEFYDVSADYFFRALQSQNLSDDEKVLISQQFADLVGDDSIYDYLKMEEVSPTSISAVDNANLENATMIKNQVVDFMKYRGAIVVAEDIIDKIKSDSTINDFLEADENEPLVKAKKEFFEAEGELTKKAYHTYDYLYNHYTVEGYSNEWLQGIVDSLEAERALYKEIHQIMVSNLYNTSGLTQFYRPTLALNYKTYSYTDSGCYSYKETVDDDIDEEATAAANVGIPENDPRYRIIYEDPYDVYHLNKATMDSNLQAVTNAVSAFDTARSDLINSVSSIAYTSGETNDIQYWKQVSDVITGANGGTNHVTNYLNKAKAMIEAYAKVVAMQGCTMDSDVPSNYESICNGYENEVTSRQSKYLTAAVSSTTDSYIILVKRLEEISAANINNIDPTKVVLSNGEGIDAALNRMSGELEAFREKLQKGVDALTVVIDGDELKGVVSLDKLLTLADNYHTELGEWKLQANTVGTNMAISDGQEINTLSSTYADQINGTAVTELETRLTNIKNQLQSVIDVIDNMKYGGKKISEIKNYNTLKNQASSVVSNSSIPLTNTEISNYVDTTFTQLFLPSVSDALYTINADTNANLKLDPADGTAETASVSVPELYVYLRSKFKDANGNKVKETEEDEGKVKGEAEDKEKNVIDADRYSTHYTGTSNIAKDFSNGSTFSLAGDAVSSLGNIVQCLYDGNVESMRDNLYLSVYATEMFSYATYDYEGQYKILEKKTDRGYEMTELNKSNFEEKYKSVEDLFNDASPKNTANKSLTNKIVSVDNNAAMGAEIEYILYGKNTNVDNVKAAYSDIYAVRYSLNLVSAFANFWNSSNATSTTLNTVAGAISVATSGIIPAAAVKVVILPILALFETANDMDRLEAGFPVELYKANVNYWHYSLGEPCTQSFSGLMSQISSLGDGFVNKTKNGNPITGLHYSDYLTLFVVIGFGSDKSEDMTLRMAEVIQANMRKVTNDTAYDIGKAKTYFKVESKIKVKPLLINISFFNQYNGAYDSSNSDWCTYDVSVIRGY